MARWPAGGTNRGGVDGEHGAIADRHRSSQAGDNHSGEQKQAERSPRALQVLPGLGTVAASAVIALLMLPLAQIQVSSRGGSVQQPLRSATGFCDCPM